MPYYYAVKIGRVPGVYKDWASCEEQVKKFPKASYKKFATEAEAWGFVCGTKFEEESHNHDTDTTLSGPSSHREAAQKFSSVTNLHEQQQCRKSAASSSIAKHQTRDSSNLDPSAAAEAVEMLRATAKTLQATAEQLMKGVGVLSTQIDQLATALCSGGSSTRGGVRESLKRSYSDFTPLGKGEGTGNGTAGQTATKKHKRMKLDPSGATDCGFTGVPFPDQESQEVYTDGASFHNGFATARAGIGVYWGPDDPYNTSERLSGRQTNNRAEIHAAEVAVRQAKLRGIQNLVLHTDSQFLINGITKWIKKWKKNGWKLTTGGDVINREDFEKLDEAISGINIKWMHVRGHQGIEGNEAADGLANAGARKPL